MNRFVSLLFIFVYLLTIPVSSMAIPAYAGKKKAKVFIVESYGKEYACIGLQEEGVISGLAAQGFIEGDNLEVKRFYMDSKARNTTLDSMREVGEIALEEIKKKSPDLVVVIDDNAFREVGLSLAGKGGIPVVFSGLNGQPLDYNKKVPCVQCIEKPGMNITGVYEKLYVEQSVRVMNAIPQLSGNTIIFISDFSPTGKALSKQFSIELKKKIDGVIYRFENVRNWEEYESLIKRIRVDDSVLAIYPGALSLENKDGQFYTAKEIIKWTIANSNKPEMSINCHFSQLGLFGGAAVDFKGMGVLAGVKAGQILHGAKAGDLPIEDAPDYSIVFNIKRADQLNIKIPTSLLTAADYVYK